MVNLIVEGKVDTLSKEPDDLIWLSTEKDEPKKEPEVTLLTFKTLAGFLAEAENVKAMYSLDEKYFFTEEEFNSVAKPMLPKSCYKYYIIKA